MNKLHIDGEIQIIGEAHTVGYEPGAMTGSETLFLRVRNGNKNVPIFISHVDEVIKMLQRGKLTIIALEGGGNDSETN